MVRRHMESDTAKRAVLQGAKGALGWVGLGWGFAAVGGWWLVVGGGWQWAVGGWWQLAAVDGSWRLAVGGGWRLAAVGPGGCP